MDDFFYEATCRPLIIKKRKSETLFFCMYVFSFLSALTVKDSERTKERGIRFLASSLHDRRTQCVSLWREKETWTWWGEPRRVGRRKIFLATQRMARLFETTRASADNGQCPLNRRTYCYASV